MAASGGPLAGHSSQRLLLLVRSTVATAFLAPVLYFQLLVGTEFSLAPLLSLIALIYASGLLYALAYGGRPVGSGWIAFQLSIDVLLATLWVYYMGGVRSQFVLLYLLIAWGAGALATRPQAVAIAALSTAAYGLMAHFIASGRLPAWEFEIGAPSPVVSGAEVTLRVFGLLVGTALLAWVSSGVAEHLRSAHRQLDQERYAVEALEALNHQLLAGMSSGLIATNRDGLVVATNRAAERITGLAESELVGRPAWEAFRSDRQFLLDLHGCLDDDNQVIRAEHRIEPEGEAHRVVGMSVTRASEIDRPRRDSTEVEGEQGSPMNGGLIFMFQDLTEVKRMERLLWLHERMGLLGRMAGSLAHEIRNPLASISGSLQMLRRGEIPLDTAPAHELMDIVTRESERLSTIIDEFLDYARPKRLDPVDVDIVRLARETVALLQNSAELLPDHRLVLEVPDDADIEPVFVLADADRIKQVFWNLARNAIQTMPDGGRLSLRVVRQPQGARVEFEDTGCGMDVGEIDRLFRPFVSGSAAGTGLGLSIV